jgi:methionyl-tRNA formyltransferase
MGTPEFGVPALRQLVLNDYPVVAVYTQPDKLAGRGQLLVPSPVKQAAQALCLPVVQPSSLKGAEVACELVRFQPDVIVVAAFGQILPPPILELPEYGCINIHPSLLPRHRGVSPVAAAILAGDRFTGVSIMLMDEGLDTGAVLARAQIPISDRDSTGSLTNKLSLVAAQLFQEVLPAWTEERITPRPQSEAEATYSATITKEAGEIDWHRSVDVIWRQVRAYQPWPGSYTRWRGKTVKIIKAMPLSGMGGVAPGQVVSLADKGFGVGTGDGVLEVLSVQLEGRRAMAAAEFPRGQRGFIGAVLPG